MQIEMQLIICTSHSVKFFLFQHRSYDWLAFKLGKKIRIGSFGEHYPGKLSPLYTSTEFKTKEGILETKFVVKKRCTAPTEGISLFIKSTRVLICLVSNVSSWMYAIFLILHCIMCFTW
ncbi:hypothetical protein SSX86_011625 [Deinandra increscens subsp. villosa]|uniref:Uncharacterized protein n=1 Tax=Deinandra increscens subsp. villosa TaxID=3103831 RepID=A0AAP0H062_9ASTR